MISQNSLCQNDYYDNLQKLTKSKRKRLNGGTVPPFKWHPGGTVPPFKMHSGGTVPPFKMHPGGTLSFYDISFLSLILYCIAKINDHSLHPFCNLSLLICSSFFYINCMEASLSKIYPGMPDPTFQMPLPVGTSFLVFCDMEKIKP